MMQRFGDWLAGHNLPSPPELTEAGIAVALAVAALALGWFAGRTLGRRIAAFWAHHVEHAEIFTGRVCEIVRHGVAAVLLGLALAGYPWHVLAALALGFATGSAAAMLVVAVLRGLNLPRWLAWTVATLAFAAILSRTIGQFAAAQDALNKVGFQIGERNITLLSLLSIGVTVLLLFAAVRLFNRLLAHWIASARGFDPAQKLLVQKLTSIAAVIVAFFVGIDLLKIDLTTFTVFSGAFGLAIGFGLQKTIGNLIAGIILLMDRSIKPGDVIVVGESFGWVNKIGVRAVSVVTRDGKEHLIPNENLMTQEVENWSYTDRNVRVRIPVTVAYDCDLKLAQALMLRAAKESPRALNNPPTNVRLTAFGESGVEHEILTWISDPESGVGNVKSDVLNRLWVMFQENGIKLPVPRRDIRITSSDAKHD
ncbi:mechanosensitive ion channel domain-containing protein [Sphingomonas sp. KR3-1]|uniref:mechanosensitive ion channel family protein n=1 Tax=Sphingomonas sp. KR3-1 TaxID=3156611 RepID=UPI0032B5B909